MVLVKYWIQGLDIDQNIDSIVADYWPNIGLEQNSIPKPNVLPSGDSQEGGHHQPVHLVSLLCLDLPHTYLPGTIITLYQI